MRKEKRRHIVKVGLSHIYTAASSLTTGTTLDMYVSTIRTNISSLSPSSRIKVISAIRLLNELNKTQKKLIATLQKAFDEITLNEKRLALVQEEEYKMKNKK